MNNRDFGKLINWFTWNITEERFHEELGYLYMNLELGFMIMSKSEFLEKGKAKERKEERKRERV